MSKEDNGVATVTKYKVINGDLYKRVPEKKVEHVLSVIASAQAGDEGSKKKAAKYVTEDNRTFYEHVSDKKALKILKEADRIRNAGYFKSW